MGTLLNKAKDLKTFDSNTNSKLNINDIKLEDVKKENDNKEDKNNLEKKKKTKKEKEEEEAEKNKPIEIPEVFDNNFYERLYNYREKHLDPLTLPANYEKSVKHFKANQIYKNEYLKALKSNFILIILLK
jgi:hypothetical protein